MENFHFQITLCLLLLLLSLLGNTVASQYFISCGSKSDITFEGRIFVGDDRRNSSLNVGASQPITNSSANSSPLYQTARIYRTNSSYKFENIVNGTYIVRLHFFPFVDHDGTDLSNALFDVSTSKFLLFSARSGSDFRAGIVKEYFLTLENGNFRIFFVLANDRSFAFVNAIEVELLPEGFISDDGTIAVPPIRAVNDSYIGLLSNSLHTLFRVNVGGSEVNRRDDPLWRYWAGDEQYLVPGVLAKNCSPFSGTFRSANGEVKDIAPDTVYRTCKQMSNISSNITWEFNVSKKAMHLVRLHFCDFISESAGTLKFNLYIQPNFKYDIFNSITTNPQTRAFLDFVAESDNSGNMNIGIGPNRSSEQIDAFLNGLELMEFVANTTLDLKNVEDGSSPRNITKLIIGISVGCVVLVSVLIIMCLLVVRHRRAKAVKAFVRDEVPLGTDRPHSWMTATSDNSASPLPNLNLKLKMPLSDILVATNNFDTKFLIGEGGFGKVYQGILVDGTKVAVKRSDSSHGQGLPEFQTEVTVLSKIRHRHLVSLIGYCDDGSEMILVYEFMEKGTLRDHLYKWNENSENSSAILHLSWKQRLEICIGAAKGLHYLHTGSDWGIIHRDVKSTNILLDEHYVAKVADFGLSHTGPPDADLENMDLIGSFGYLDPEYVRTFQLTYKSDVYSFGVVLLEVLCARLPIINSSTREEINLAEWAMHCHKKGKLETIVDPVLAGQINPNSLRKFGEITERCLKKEGADRPTMLDVCWDLEYALQLQQTAVYRDPHEDSTTDVSSNYIFPASSTQFTIGEDRLYNGDDDEDFDSKLVFSRSMLDGPR